MDMFTLATMRVAFLREVVSIYFFLASFYFLFSLLVCINVFTRTIQRSRNH